MWRLTTWGLEQLTSSFTYKGMCNTHTHTCSTWSHFQEALSWHSMKHKKGNQAGYYSVKSGHCIPNDPHWAEMNTIFPPLLIGGWFNNTVIDHLKMKTMMKMGWMDNSTTLNYQPLKIPHVSKQQNFWSLQLHVMHFYFPDHLPFH